MTKFNEIGIKQDLVSFAKGDTEATDDNIIVSYNKHSNSEITELTEVEFKMLSYFTNCVISDNTTGKRDAIARFIIIEQKWTFYRELVKHKGLFFALFINLMSKLRDVNIKI